MMVDTNFGGHQYYSASLLKDVLSGAFENENKLLDWKCFPYLYFTHPSKISFLDECVVQTHVKTRRKKKTVRLL